MLNHKVHIHRKFQDLCGCQLEPRRYSMSLKKLWTPQFQHGILFFFSFFSWCLHSLTEKCFNSSKVIFSHKNYTKSNLYKDTPFHGNHLGSHYLQKFNLPVEMRLKSSGGSICVSGTIANAIFFILHCELSVKMPKMANPDTVFQTRHRL